MPRTRKPLNAVKDSIHIISKINLIISIRRSFGAAAQLPYNYDF